MNIVKIMASRPANVGNVTQGKGEGDAKGDARMDGGSLPKR